MAVADPPPFQARLHTISGKKADIATAEVAHPSFAELQVHTIRSLRSKNDSGGVIRAAVHDQHLAARSGAQTAFLNATRHADSQQLYEGWRLVMKGSGTHHLHAYGFHPAG
jgi:hypothetical protein